MAVIKVRPTSPGRRHYTRNISPEISSTNNPEKSLLGKASRRNGRNNTGKITMRHRGGGHKRKVRIIDFKRNKYGVPGKVATIEYDPNRSANIALIFYSDGEKRYIISPNGIKIGQKIISGPDVEPEIGNALPLRNIPAGVAIHNIEIRPGKGGQLVRGAGNSALIQSKEDKYVTILLPSKEIRLINADCMATIGQVGNMEVKTMKLGKAGRRRHMGWRPAVRGVAMHPGAHPHGGGEGRSGIGMKSPKSPWGKRTLGKKTRKNKKYSDKFIIKDRRQK